MTSSLENLVDGLRRGDPASTGRVISVIEDRPELSDRLMEKLYPLSGKAAVLGVTGSPGAGKSTLVDGIAARLAAAGKKVAIIAVDPSSPFTGGAVLGDRVRMNSSTAIDAGQKGRIFIRSMASRGALGGIAPKTTDAVVALDAAGFDTVIVETVGVGQAEVEIIKTCDTAIVVLVPGMGDTVQALKAGIMEIADVFAINKADHAGADRLEKEVRSVIALGPGGKDGAPSWAPPIVQTIATEQKGIDELIAQVSNHRAWAAASGGLAARKQLFMREALLKKLGEQMMIRFQERADAAELIEKGVKELAARSKSPGIVANEILSLAYPVK